MRSLFMRTLVITICLCLLSIGAVQANSVPSSASSRSATAASSECGRLTEVKGNVYRRGFADASKEIWAEPVTANLGDTVSDGMQVGTGPHSWTQCTWKNVTARAWENSVYMVSPSQKLVYLVGGELLFNLDKHRKDKSPYSIWTKYLHASVRGTTLLVQSTPEGSKVSVLEGTIDVTNRLDNSVVTLTPGVVYEVNAKDYDKNSSSDQANSAETKSTSDIRDAALDSLTISSQRQALENLAYGVVRQEGEGLGLSIASNLVQKICGKITVQSEVGVGTRFDISFQRYKSSAEMSDINIDEISAEDSQELLSHGKVFR